MKDLVNTSNGNFPFGIPWRRNIGCNNRRGQNIHKMGKYIIIKMTVAMSRIRIGIITNGEKNFFEERLISRSS